MDVLRRSTDGKVVIRKRRVSRKEGPFEFFYVAIHRAEEEDELWKLVSFQKDGFIPVRSYDMLRKRELVEKHGARAYAIMCSIAERPERVPKEFFQAAQLKLPIGTA